jgi:NAD(P)-dependent dehydrogenase (short-subunit alcohol dehydrogenase family)
MLQRKTVIVSGVGAGLGQRIAAAVVGEGGNAVLGARTEANLAKTAQEIDPEGAHTAWRVTDIAEEAQRAALAALAVEPSRIRVNTVPPGWMYGPPVQAYLRFTAHTEGVPEDEVLGRLTDQMALPELATDGDVAEAVIFLASDRARAITGQSVLVNAGELMR